MTLADTLVALAEHYPHDLRITGRDSVVFAGGNEEHRLGSLVYANDAYGLTDDLMRLAARLNITVTISSWNTITPMFTAFGTDDVPTGVKWRATAAGMGRALAGMLLDATTNPERPREPSPEEVALSVAEEAVGVLRAQLVVAERRRDELLRAYSSQVTLPTPEAQP